MTCMCAALLRMSALVSWFSLTYHLMCSTLASTAFHANELGFRTVLIDDCSRGIKEENISSSYNKLRTEFACVVQSSEVGQGEGRLPQHHPLCVPGEGDGAGAGQEVSSGPEAGSGVPQEYQISIETQEFQV